MQQNLDVCNFELTESEMEAVKAMNRNDAGTIPFNDPKFIRHLIETYG